MWGARIDFIPRHSIWLHVAYTQIPRFIAAFTTAHRRSVSYATWIQPILSIRFILILSSCLYLILPTVLSPSGLSNQNAHLSGRKPIICLLGILCRLSFDIFDVSGIVYPPVSTRLVTILIDGLVKPLYCVMKIIIATTVGFLCRYVDKQKINLRAYLWNMLQMQYLPTSENGKCPKIYLYNEWDSHRSYVIFSCHPRSVVRSGVYLGGGCVFYELWGKRIRNFTHVLCLCSLRKMHTASSSA